MPRTSDASADRLRRSSRWFLAACAIALALRVTTLIPEIDAPHAWRQCDTASFTHNFYTGGIHLLAPQVHWLGNHRTLLLEFPLSEAIVALLYHLVTESLIVDRLVYLAFFIGSAFYFHRTVRLFEDRTFARIATVAYAFIPLGIFYSRAVHIDFAAMFFAHGLLYHGLRAATAGAPVQWIATLVMGIFAFLIKAPYALPAIPAILTPLVLRFDRRRAVTMATVLGLMVVPFAGWRVLAARNAATIPDLSVIPHWYSQGDMAWWYFGTLDQRTSYANWRELLYYRTVDSSLGWVAAIVVAAGALIFLFRRRHTIASRVMVAAWAAGLAAYVLIFFNLHLEMDYYQIPMMGVWAWWAATAVDAIATRHRLVGLAVGIVALIACVVVSRTSFFFPRTDQVAAAHLISEATPADGLVIAVDSGVTLYSAPCTLSESDRFGWALHTTWLSPAVVARLKELGATHVALYTRKPEEVALHACPFCGVPVVERARTLAGSLVSVFDLRAPPAPAVVPISH